MMSLIDKEMNACRLATRKDRERLQAHILDELTSHIISHFPFINN